MKLRTGRLIKKRRHVVKVGKTRIEVDVFKGDHRGLVIAEVELPSSRARFVPPTGWAKRSPVRRNTITPTWLGHKLLSATSGPFSTCLTTRDRFQCPPWVALSRHPVGHKEGRSVFSAAEFGR